MSKSTRGGKSSSSLSAGAEDPPLTRSPQLPMGKSANNAMAETAGAILRESLDAATTSPMKATAQRVHRVAQNRPRAPALSRLASSVEMRHVVWGKSKSSTIAPGGIQARSLPGLVGTPTARWPGWPVWPGSHTRNGSSRSRARSALSSKASTRHPRPSASVLTSARVRRGEGAFARAPAKGAGPRERYPTRNASAAWEQYSLR